MHKLKNNNKHCPELDPDLVAAIDRAVEAAISSKLAFLDSHITQTIKNCICGEKKIEISNEWDNKIFHPGAGP
jgi:hypothetical protein